MILNSEQEKAVNAINGVYVCISGPGSGKTTVLLRRHLTMLAMGIPSTDILTLTFTNAAATELVKRAELPDSESVFRTFHGWALDFLKKERANLPFKTCDTIIPVAMQDFELLFSLAKTFPAIKNWRTLQEKIQDWKKRGIAPKEAVTDAKGTDYFFAKAYEEYERRSREEGWLDFDSVMVETVRLLERLPDVRARHQCAYIAVDECQDTDSVQFRLLQLLFGGNIFVVGDENQLIYEWRSAQPGNLTNFSRLFPESKVLFLGQNYRSTKAIVEFLREILPVDNGLGSRMVTENEEGNAPTFTKYTDADQEADTVLRKAIAHDNPEGTAIIARTNRQLFIFQRLCTMRSVKYRILGKKDFWELNEIKKLLHIAKSCHDARPAPVVLSELIRQHNLIEVYRHAGKPLETSPTENLNSIVQMSAGKGNVHEFMDYLRRLTRARKSSKGLTLSTVHQAKGREWDNVYVIGVNQGTMPHREGLLSEEERIFFVACSRAAKRLELSFHDERSEFIEHRESEIVCYAQKITKIEPTEWTLEKAIASVAQSQQKTGRGHNRERIRLIRIAADGSVLFRCSGCKRELSADDFHKCRVNLTGLASKCKLCRYKVHRNRVPIDQVKYVMRTKFNLELGLVSEKVPVITRTIKKCPSCERELDLRHFGKNAATIDGRSAYCGDCVRKRYLENNPPKKRGRSFQLKYLEKAMTATSKLENSGWPDAGDMEVKIAKDLIREHQFRRFAWMKKFLGVDVKIRWAKSHIDAANRRYFDLPLTEYVKAVVARDSEAAIKVDSMWEKLVLGIDQDGIYKE